VKKYLSEKRPKFSEASETSENARIPKQKNSLKTAISKGKFSRKNEKTEKEKM